MKQYLSKREKKGVFKIKLYFKTLQGKRNELVLDNESCWHMAKTNLWLVSGIYSPLLITKVRGTAYKKKGGGLHVDVGKAIPIFWKNKIKSVFIIL